ncbi:MAG TPA: UV DNA damage repair endonuclease UvsE, partial [Spirochaetia bacterium]|nr:UV DNA damage repair endonuclease UvsE [Spirochaetia bacterium]
MKIGYPCINRTLRCTAGGTFRLASYTNERFIKKTAANLDCLERMLRWNAAHGVYLFRIGSGLVPFASHPAVRVPWREVFRERFAALGGIIRDLGI